MRQANRVLLRNGRETEVLQRTKNFWNDGCEKVLYLAGLQHLGQRVREVESVQREHPNKVPVIIERYANENQLPPLDRSKFLIPEHVTVGELMKILRRRLQLNSSQSIFLLLNGRNLPATAATFAEIYSDERDPDGFLYIVYASHEAFG